MKTRSCVFSVVLAGLLAGSCSASEGVTVSVFDFQADGNFEAFFGTENAGKSAASLLTYDLSDLAPLSAKDRGPVQEGFDFDVPIAPAEAERMGRALGATSLVNGRLLRAGTSIVIAARVVSAETGRTYGTMVRGDPSTPIADLISQLSIQIGKITLVQNGVNSVSWGPADIVGTCKPGSLLSHDEVACVMDIDGRAIPDEVKNWSQKQQLQPGLHEIFIRYYDGTSTAGHSFIINASPGASYEVRYERQPNSNPVLWIQDRLSQQPVTKMANASVGGGPHIIKNIDEGPFGWFSGQYLGSGPPVVPPAK